MKGTAVAVAICATVLCTYSPVAALQDGVAGSAVDAGDRTPGTAELPTLLAGPPPPPSVRDEALQLLEEGMEVWRDEGEESGARMVDAALSRLPSLADWRPLIRAELLAPTGDTARVHAALGRLDRSEEYWARWGWEILVDAYEEANDPEGARRIAQNAAETAYRADRAADAWLRSGRIALEAGDTASALNDLRAALEHDPGVPAARAAAAILDRAPSPGVDDLVLGEALLAGGAWESAHRRLAPLLDADEIPEDRRDLIRLDLGRGLTELSRPREARAMLSPLISDPDVDPEVAAEALYWRGRGALDRGAVDAAREDFVLLARSAPGSYDAERGLSLLLRRELETGFGPRARALLEELLATGASGSDATRQIVQLASSRYLDGDFQDAVALFRRHEETTGRSSARQQAAYWTALSLERIGELEAAHARFESVHSNDPLSFYGVLAGERAGLPVLPSGLAEGPAPVPGLDTELANALVRLHVHRFVPTSGSFAFELARLTEHFNQRGDGAYDFAEALIEGELPLQGAVLGREIHDREEQWNLRLLRIVHPLPYRETIVRESRARGLDPFFVAGTIRQESMFDPDITSVAGAVGLMQLLPSTARELARTVGLRYSDDGLTDPDTNLRLGIQFLSDLVRRFDGRAEDALTAYNAGPSRTIRWRRDPAYREPDVFVEHIPFAETRDYVKSVQRYVRVYAALYGCGDFDPCLGLSYPEIVARSVTVGGAPRSGLTR